MSPATASDFAPVADRLRFLGWLRLALAVAVVAAALTGATPSAVPGPVLVATTALYLAGLVTIDEWWRRRPGQGLAVVGLGLLVDGLYLAWAATVTGGTGGIAPLLVLGHVAGVTLLVSYRTGMKVAVWHALLVYAAFELQLLGIFATAGLGTEDFRAVAAYVGVLGLLAVGTASFSAVNERELRRRRGDLEALAALATELEEALATELEDTREPATVVQILADRLREAFGFSRVIVLGGADATRVLAGAGVSPRQAEVPPATDRSVLRRAWEQRRTQRVTHLPTADDPGVAAALPEARNVLVVPLGAADGALEAVVAEYGDIGRGGIEQRVVSAVERFVDHGALAMRTARLLEEVRRLATIDGLTGVANRRGFDLAVQEELARVDRFGEPLVLLLLDIDRFKSVNDRYGHQTGDIVLRGVARTLVESSRPFDTVARYGGEEFAVLAPRSNARNALQMAERLRVNIEDADLAVPVTVSIGVAVAKPHGIGAPEALIKVADEALSVSKGAGRNRVTML